MLQFWGTQVQPSKNCPIYFCPFPFGPPAFLYLSISKWSNSWVLVWVRHRVSTAWRQRWPDLDPGLKELTLQEGRSECDCVWMYGIIKSKRPSQRPGLLILFCYFLLLLLFFFKNIIACFKKIWLDLCFHSFSAVLKIRSLKMKVR